jgi:hypothetical protein
VRDGASDIEALAEAVALALENIPVTEKRIEAFTGSGNWTVPAGVTYAIAHMLGGGGGSGQSSSGGNGGDSTVAFAGGTATGLGARKIATQTDMSAGVTEAAAANSGRSATYAQNFTNSRSSLMASDAVMTVAGASVTPAATIAVVVGAGGSAGTNGAAGASGYVYIEYYEEV